MPVYGAVTRPSLIIPVLWGVFSNGEWRAGIGAGWAFRTRIGPRRLTINSEAFATLMRPSLANVQQGEPMLVPTCASTFMY
jgi:hypothetical protein